MIDRVEDLMKLSRDELDEVLLKEKYNKANLREVIRRTLAFANDYKDACEYLNKVREEEQKALRSAARKINHVLDLDN
ncbi:hypothetical protein ACIQGW_05135 [Lysinibacillus xylanilyticus]|uniref:hypothetical protein n=1 Tax=Lysinibacillus xylanilyticus TaxID=582475 RepID=UPI0037FD1B4E